MKINACGLAAALLLFACAATPDVGAAQEARTVPVWGLVVSSTTEAPLANAEVFFPELRMGSRSDFQGKFAILNVPPGEYELRVRRVCFETRVLTVTVTEEGAEVAPVEMTWVGADGVWCPRDR